MYFFGSTCMFLNTDYWNILHIDWCHTTCLAIFKIICVSDMLTQTQNLLF